ncbi:MAG: biotin/lipoyl-binding protein, partial [Alphaproteobacteria bacterium]|nr:biotin/lipoyl-binding protein [Alphaproteobacteria bacterium]
EAFIAGLKTNNAFLIRALRHKDFISGEVDTGFIARHEADLIPPVHVPEDAYQMAAHAMMHETWRQDGDAWDSNDAFRNSGAASQFVDFVVDGKRHAVALPGLPLSHNTDFKRLANGDVAVMEHGETWVLKPYDPFAEADAAGASTDKIVTPMPGKIIQLLVKPGEAVKKGQPLAILEAMKMEHTLAAPADAKVRSVEVSQGDQVPEATVVVRFEAAAA